jgi:hypothetical protein
MQTGDLVNFHNINGQIIDVLPNSIVIETGNRVLIANKAKVKILFSIGDEVYLKGTNKSFVIQDFAFNEDDKSWKAEREENSSSGFQSNKKLWINVEDIQKKFS